MSKICAPIKKKASLSQAQKVADLIEVWFDELPSISEIFANKKKPFIYKVTNPKNIEKVLQHKPEYIDLDISTPKKTIQKIKEKYPKTTIIISFHDFDRTPDIKILRKTALKILSKGADIIKIATHAKEFKDSLQMLSFLSELTQKGHKAICICMGEKGRLTRAAGHLFGNYLMYAPIKKSEATAKGQIDAYELKKIYGT